MFYNIYFLFNTFLLHKAKQSNEKFDASQLHDREKQKHKTEILPDDGTGDVEVENKVFDVFVLLICFCLGSQLISVVDMHQTVAHQSGVPISGTFNCLVVFQKFKVFVFFKPFLKLRKISLQLNQTDSEIWGLD